MDKMPRIVILIKELQPKAKWHDEEQERRRIAEAEAAHKKKHRFGCFGRHHH